MQPDGQDNLTNHRIIPPYQREYYSDYKSIGKNEPSNVGEHVGVSSIQLGDQC